MITEHQFKVGDKVSVDWNAVGISFQAIETPPPPYIIKQMVSLSKSVTPSCIVDLQNDIVAQVELRHIKPYAMTAEQILDYLAKCDVYPAVDDILEAWLDGGAKAATKIIEYFQLPDIDEPFE